ncbi:MAG: hybrid sensor histidine kinase/response regulator [Xanthomonadales bacterium]|nr:hybrid sensor histidine kinase/response regulator [Xanthomonadales bacterium]
MLNPWILSLIVLAYMGLLFAIAWYGDKQRIGRDHRKFKAIIYSLSLAVYCTSWTFYGAVGSAASTGWGFLPIYLGPVLMMLFGFDIIRRIAVTSRDQRITSIADFIAYRYGRSHTVAVLVTCAAVIGAVPYIALQLKGITSGIDVISRATGNASVVPDQLPLYLALSLAVFAMMFGTRNMDASEHHRGLMWAIAFESVVKLLAFVAIGLFAIFGIFDGLGSVAETMRENADYQQLFTPWRLPEGFGIQLLMGMVAILCLPRQFHVAIVEFRDTTDLRVARWIFPAYLIVFAALVIPIALAGLTQFSGQDVNPDSYVLSLPLAFDRPVLTLLAFIGGFSAATGMVIVSTVALAIMVSNDIVMPLLLRSGLTKRRVQRDLSQTLLRARRVSILLLALAAVAYYEAIEAGVPLASIGLLSFSAAAQFAPAMLIGIYWQRASKTGAIWGLSLGVGSWVIWLLFPSVATTGQQQSLFSIIPSMSFNQGAMFSLLLNASALIFVSLLKPDKESSSAAGAEVENNSGLITVEELENTIGRFLGMNKTRKALSTHMGLPRFKPGALATPETIQFGERLLAGAIGSASARTVLSTALHHQGLGPEAVMDLLDRTSQAVQFNRELLESTLDNMSQGVSVVDQGMRLVGWNRRYVELMDYPEGTLHIGKPIIDLIQLNAKRGLIEDHKSEIQKRVTRLRGGEVYRYERKWLGNKVLEIQGNPLPGGGYVTTFTDITHFKDIEYELQMVNETLEQRVQQRTFELSEANTNLEQARQVAEEANLSKTRFLAAASHDLLQPMNAASLFVSILRQQQEGTENEQSQLVKRIDRSLKASEQLLSALLDISKLDSGMYDPEPESIHVPELFEQLRRRFKALAGNHDLVLRVHALDRVIFSDRNLLYRILQNFLANAIHYTETGGVLLGCRLRGDKLRISIWDTGIGIAEAEVKAIFQEFHRLEYARRMDEKGLGLGLAICDRIARMLKHTINVSSNPGRGSCFSVTVPLALATDRPPSEIPDVIHTEPTGLKDLVVLCVDNEPDILEAMNLLLDRWGCPTVLLAETQAQATQQVLKLGAPDFVLMDYQLNDQSDGLQVMQHLDSILKTSLPAIVITADRSSELEEAVKARGYGLLRKPIRPAALRALMSNMMKTKS